MSNRQYIKKSIALSLFIIIIIALMLATGSAADTVSVEITAYSLKVRSSPDTDSEVIGGLIKGQQVIAAVHDKDWFTVTMPDNRQGFISARFATIITDAPPVESQDADIVSEDPADTLRVKIPADSLKVRSSEEELPNEILEKLAPLKDKQFNTEGEFLEAVRQEIGNDKIVKYKERILQHAPDDIEEIKRISEVLQEQNRAIEALQAQNRALAKRLAELEAARDERAQKQEVAESIDKKRLEQRVKELETDQAALAEGIDQKPLEQRVKELETDQAARDEATRAIIRDAVSTLGSKINESVALGGTLEVLVGSSDVFIGQSEKVQRLSTAQIDLEIQVNPWTLGSLIIEYDDGKDTQFITSEGSEESVDRINLDTAFVTIGDTQRFPPFMKIGRMIVPFGISTGNPVADVLTIQDPLTIEVFETKEDAIMIGFGLPTPPLTPATPPVTPPRVRPLVIKPIIGSLMRRLGYDPPPRRPSPPTPVTLTPPPPPFTGGIYFYRGDTQVRFRGIERRSTNIGATLGYRTKGNCGRPYDELRGSAFCPWSIGVDIDYNNSVFDSRFLESEYRPFLSQLRYVPGMAASVKATLGPTSLVAEWNGSTTWASFADELGNPVRIRPAAWQVTLGYQFDWNPWMVIGTQGNYIAFGYSESRYMAGVSRVLNGALSRSGAVPKRRYLVSVGEWVLDGVRIAFEYSHIEDYLEHEGGTGRTADGFFSQLTYEW
jgi:hypothetical protein